jgi:hypothetical protein
MERRGFPPPATKQRSRKDGTPCGSRVTNALNDQAQAHRLENCSHGAPVLIALFRKSAVELRGFRFAIWATDCTPPVAMASCRRAISSSGRPLSLRISFRKPARTRMILKRADQCFLAHFISHCLGPGLARANSSGNEIRGGRHSGCYGPGRSLTDWAGYLSPCQCCAARSDEMLTLF